MKAVACTSCSPVANWLKMQRVTNTKSRRFAEVALCYYSNLLLHHLFSHQCLGNKDTRNRDFGIICPAMKHLLEAHMHYRGPICT
jgi:hypothetical protein